MAALISRRVGLAAVRGPSRAAKKTRIVTARFVPQNHIEETEAMLEVAIKKAKDLDKAGSKQAAKVAWDEVEELSAAVGHMHDDNKADVKGRDPLEVFCGDYPEADECRIYED